MTNDQKLAERVHDAEVRLARIEAALKNPSEDQLMRQAQAIQAMRACIVYARDRRGPHFDFDTWEEMVDAALEKGDVPPHALENAQSELLRYQEVLTKVRNERDELIKQKHGRHPPITGRGFKPGCPCGDCRERELEAVRKERDELQKSMNPPGGHRARVVMNQLANCYQLVGCTCGFETTGEQELVEHVATMRVLLAALTPAPDPSNEKRNTIVIHETYGNYPSSTLEIMDEGENKFRVRVREPSGKASIFLNERELARLQLEIGFMRGERITRPFNPVPEHDDLTRVDHDDTIERIQCPRAGQVLHHGCGWCQQHNRPSFECLCNGPRVNALTFRVPFCEHCSVHPPVHGEHWHDKMRWWCADHVPMSGHYEHCPTPCRDLVKAVTPPNTLTDLLVRYPHLRKP